MQKNEIIRLRIEELNHLGNGLAHACNPDGSRGIAVFVQNAVPGDLVDARVIKVNKNYLVARIERLLESSPMRIEESFCAASGCGGCVYRHLRYESELQSKREQVKNAFRRAGLLQVTVEEVRHTGQTDRYRNKAQYPVGNGKEGMVFGFYASSSHRIVSFSDCRLQPPLFQDIAREVCAFCDAKGIRAYEEESGRGLLRHIYLREGKATGEIMLCLVVNGERLPHEEELVARLTSRFAQIRGILLNTNTANTNVVLGKKYRTLFGAEKLEDELCGLRFAISAGSFYQVNHDACELLYGLARERAGLSGKETLLDLYCGIGTIGLSMARDAREVIGVEIVEEAVRCASENAKRNGIENAHFYCGDASDARRLLTAAEEAHGALEPSGTVVILDPPRKGSTPELITYLSERNFEQVVYISCNPETLARDCAIFKEYGYDIGTVTPVDLFPRTGHVESVVCLTRHNELPMA